MCVCVWHIAFLLNGNRIIRILCAYIRIIMCYFSCFSFIQQMSQKLDRVLCGLSYCWTFHHSSDLVLQRSSFLSFVSSIDGSQTFGHSQQNPKTQFHWLFLSFNASLLAVSESFELKIYRAICSVVFLCLCDYFFMHISTFRPFRCSTLVSFMCRMYCVLYSCTLV